MMCGGRDVAGEGEALHALLTYDSDEGLRSRAVPYLQEGFERDETVVAVVSAEAEHVLRAALGADAARVRWQVDGVSYARLGAMFEGFRRFLAEQRAAGVALRLLAQNDVRGSADRMAAYLRFEAMATPVLGSFGFPWACLYDTRIHSVGTLDGAQRTHPCLLDARGREVHNADYVDPGDYLTRSRPPAPPPVSPGVDLAVDGPSELAAFRHSLRRWAALQMSGGHEVDGVVIAVGEAVTNALQHGAPPVRVQAWTADGTVSVRVHDAGSTAIPVDAGYRRPPPEADHGYGLWVARQLADAVTTCTDLTGTVTALDFPAASVAGRSRPARRGRAGPGGRGSR
jgi:anti-sigma regulatory factor (Ser/Thr protein kinase)